jgi:hypothetical protein
MAKTMKKSTSVLLLLSFIVVAAAVASSSAAAATSNNDRIKVPLHRRLVDALSEAATNTASSTSSSIRQFEIEAEIINDGEEEGITTTSLMVDEIEEMAITSRTTYSFPKHRREKFHPDYIQNVALLASRNNGGSTNNNNNNGGLTIISVNKANGNVQGIQHGGSNGGGGTNNLKRISIDSTTNKLRLQTATTDERGLREKAANWTCGAEHAHDHDDEEVRHHHHHHHSRSLQDNHHQYQNSSNVMYEYVKTRSANPSASASATTRTWIPPKKYTFHIPLYIEVDSKFVNRQGGINEAIEYVNFLTSAVNIIIENEVDAHLEVIHVEETDIYDNITSTQDALRVQRLRPRENLAGYSNYYGLGDDDNNDDNNDDKIILVHALLGRHVGGGIAYIDTVCDKKWSFGVTSDIQGSFTNLGKDALLDMFYYAHELGHSLGSGHTYDAYEPVVDTCGAVCTLKDGLKSDPVGLPLNNSATIMSYCNFCTGGMDNIALTYGGLWDGMSPRTDIGHWMNHPDVAGVGTVSVEPRRVSHTIWNLLSTKVKECVEPPSQSQGLQGCNDSSDCNDNSICTIDVCSSDNVCVVSETLDNCCGNGVCEQGEIGADCSDCGPFIIKPPNPCEDCHALDGFILEVGVSENANQAVSLTSISLQHKAPEQFRSSVEVFIARPFNSAEATELNSSLWQRVATATVPGSEGLMEIDLPLPIIIDVAGKVEIYIAATEQLLQFGVGAYSIENDHGVQLHSSHAVSGRFGTALESFSLNCEVKYVVSEMTPILDDFKNERWSALSEFPWAENTLTANVLNDKVSSAVMHTSITLYSATAVVLFALLNIMW